MKPGELYNPEVGYEYAQHNLTGYVVSMGPLACKLVPMRQRNLDVAEHPYASWQEYQWFQRLGFVPSCWCFQMIQHVSNVTDKEMLWLADKSTSLQAAIKWRTKRLKL